LHTPEVYDGLIRNEPGLNDPQNGSLRVALQACLMLQIRPNFSIFAIPEAIPQLKANRPF
jgi:hypothetical protein